MAIIADSKDYKDGFTKHYHTYIKYSDEDSISRRLILVYCVECGLKHLLMNKYRINTLNDVAENIKRIFLTHDFRKLLKELNLAGNYNFTYIETCHCDNVEPKNYHEMHRYGIRTKNKDNYRRVELYDSQLAKIAELIKERL